MHATYYTQNVKNMLITQKWKKKRKRKRHQTCDERTQKQKANKKKIKWETLHFITLSANDIISNNYQFDVHLSAVVYDAWMGRCIVCRWCVDYLQCDALHIPTYNVNILKLKDVHAENGTFIINTYEGIATQVLLLLSSLTIFYPLQYFFCIDIKVHRFLFYINWWVQCT